MGVFDGFVICTDFDNTLRSSDQSITVKNSQAIRYFQDNGGLFTLATGRHSDMIDEFKDFFVPNTYVIIMNGTMIYDMKSKEVICKLPMKDNCLDILAYVINTYDYVEHIRIHSGDDIVYWHKGMSAENTLKAIRESLKMPLYKFIFEGSAEGCQKLIKELTAKFSDDYDFDRSWPNGVEMHSDTSGKGICVKKLKELLGEQYTIIGVGDYENDITLVRDSDIGIAVGNAIDSVKAVADLVTVTNDESAIAKIIYDIEEGKIKRAF